MVQGKLSFDFFLFLQSLIILNQLQCHARSNELDFLKRSKLAEEFSAPLGNQEKAKANFEPKERKTTRSAGNAILKNSKKIPESKNFFVTNFFKNDFQSD